MSRHRSQPKLPYPVLSRVQLKSRIISPDNHIWLRPAQAKQLLEVGIIGEALPVHELKKADAQKQSQEKPNQEKQSQEKQSQEKQDQEKLEVETREAEAQALDALDAEEHAKKLEAEEPEPRQKGK